MTSDAQKRAVKKYDRANTIQFSIKLNRKTDADIIEKMMSVENKQGYVKTLIRSDIKDC